MERAIHNGDHQEYFEQIHSGNSEVFIPLCRDIPLVEIVVGSGPRNGQYIADEFPESRRVIGNFASRKAVVSQNPVYQKRWSVISSQNY